MDNKKTACEVCGHQIVGHFVDVTKMVDLRSGSQREVDDVMLTRSGRTTEPAISREHVTNNEAVRRTLLERGIRPETLPPAEDVKKVERRLATETKKSLKHLESLDN